MSNTSQSSVNLGSQCLPHQCRSTAGVRLKGSSASAAASARNTFHTGMRRLGCNRQSDLPISSRRSHSQAPLVGVGCSAWQHELMLMQWLPHHVVQPLVPHSSSSSYARVDADISSSVACRRAGEGLATRICEGGLEGRQEATIERMSERSRVSRRSRSSSSSSRPPVASLESPCLLAPLGSSVLEPHLDPSL